MTKSSQLMDQYLQVKAEYNDCILFFRLGDFYEMFFDDAITASRELEIVLTARDSAGEKVPMCGVPFHAASGYMGRLLEKGYKVAICEQIEDPRTAKGLIKREVVRVVTPGTIVESQLLQEKSNNYLTAIASSTSFYGVAYVDISTGEFKTTQFSKNQIQLLLAELNRVKPAEIIVSAVEASEFENILQRTESLITIGKPRNFQEEHCYRILKEHFKVQNLRSFGCEEQPASICAAGAILHYLEETQKGSLYQLRNLVTYEIGDYMALDPATRRNLELVKTIRGGEVSGSLLGILDLTVTSMGARTLKNWIEQPLAKQDGILERQAAVADFASGLELRENLRASLKSTYDLQRILSRLAANSANARDLLALRNTLRELPAIKQLIEQVNSVKLQALRDALDPLDRLTQLLTAALLDEPPLTIKEGGIIREDYHPELKQLLTASSQGKQWVAQLEQAERERTGIKSLKISFNNVFGYFIEITKSNLTLVPDDYIRKQTLANCERFINQQLKDYEGLILNAHEKSVALEYQLFMELREAVLAEIDCLQTNANILAELDALCSLAEVAVRYHYVRPEFNDDSGIKIIDGRHPVVERMLPSSSFVPNDTLITPEDNRTQVITGPNMAGKSTYMRQVALIVLMAHIGSFVPARSAELALVDRIFTRVGASDDLATGQSTFMVEMNEVAYILNHATAASFIILDEIGRGTSTFDGLSIAWAVIEFINNSNRIGAKTLVATHYHELTELETKMKGIKNYHVAVECEGDEITFLRKILPGSAAQSYGIQVAALAGLPVELTDRAKEILQTLEQKELVQFNEIHNKPVVPKAQQLTLFHTASGNIIEQLKAADLVATTPLQALNLLYQWQQELKQEET